MCEGGPGCDSALEGIVSMVQRQMGWGDLPMLLEVVMLTMKVKAGWRVGNPVHIVGWMGWYVRFGFGG